MILQTGLRTDIPAFYAKWFAERLKAGYVCVRNPYNPVSVTRYKISPDVIDLIALCTKNPEGIKGAESVAAVIYLARTGSSKDEIREYVTRQFGYDLTRTCDEIRPGYHHVETGKYEF